jgi:O-antigen chain-terminating methyltransferase
LKDIRTHWSEWRLEWERKLSQNEMQFLRGLADMQAAYQHRSTLMESNFRDIAKSQHQAFETVLDKSVIEIQQRLWQDMEKVRGEYERLIHTELRLVRQRAIAAPAAAVAPLIADQAPPRLQFDYARFAERFRGSEDYVRQGQKFYLPFFQGRADVLDIGCGRGEFLELMRDAGVPARGIEQSAESVALCRQKGLAAEEADLFAYLAAQPEARFDGIFCGQVVEHIEPDRLPELVSLASSRLARGGVLAIETPNPECLAIFATHFYLDPTHRRPVPHPLLAFYMEEHGMGKIEVHKLSAAVESMPALATLPPEFREAFFGGLDYAIVARKLT